MAYLEEKKRQDGTSKYYLVKSIRLENNKFKKIRISFDKKPTNKQIEKALKEIRLKTSIKENDLEYLDLKEIEILDELNELYKEKIKQIPSSVIKKSELDFEIRFTYNSNAIEGNRLTLRATGLIFKEKIIPSGDDINTKDVIEAVNGRDTLDLIKKYKTFKLDNKILEKINYELTKNTNLTYPGRIRFFPISISGSEHIPPQPDKVKPMLETVYKFYKENKKKLHPVILSFMLHGQIAHIHPFEDGNGRTARSVMNYYLIYSKFPKFYINSKNLNKYYETLEFYDKGDYKTYCKKMFQLVCETFQK